MSFKDMYKEYTRELGRLINEGYVIIAFLGECILMERGKSQASVSLEPSKAGTYKFEVIEDGKHTVKYLTHNVEV